MERKVKMHIIGQAIEHTVFGAGVVSALAEHTVTIQFCGAEKKFIYPDAFKNYLVLKDQETQRRLEKQIRDREIAEGRIRLAEQARQDKMRKLSNFKVAANSHAVFHITEEQIDQATATWQVSTGTYLSGYSRGLPRAADRIKPNSVCLLTTRRAGADERERSILGAFMVGEDFFGEEAHDGMIKAHAQHRIIVPEECHMLFWDHFGQTEPPKWGNTAFKYCSGNVVNKILADMTELLKPTGQKDTAADFYRYFCRINRLQALIKQDDEKSMKAPAQE